jgi:hypothetical protein
MADEDKDRQPSGERSFPRGRWLWVGAMLLVLLAALHARLGPELTIALDHDECSTVRSYGSIPYDVCLPQYRGQGQFDVRLLAKGLAKCFLNHWDPANHYASSLAVSFATFLFGASEMTFRLPSLLAGLAVCLLLVETGRRRSGSLLCGLLLGLAAAYHPYLVSYSLASRGYIWTVLLVLAQITWIDHLARRQGELPLWTNLGMVALGVAIFMNLLSTPVMWLVPLFAVATWWWRPPANPVHGPRQWVRHIWHGTPYQQWLAQGILVGAFVLFFFLLKLPDILVAQHKYGKLLVDPVRQIGPELAALAGAYAPGLWLGWLLVAVAGLVLACTKRGWHWLGPVQLFAFLLTACYSLAGKKLLYGRTYGVWLPAAFVLCAHLWGVVSGCKGRKRQVMLTVLTLVFVGGIGQSVLALARSPEEVRRHHLQGALFYNEAARLLEQSVCTMPAGERDRLLLALPQAWGGEMMCYLDQARDGLGLTPLGREGFDLGLFCQLSDGGAVVRVRTLDRRWAENTFWPVPPALTEKTELLRLDQIVVLRLKATAPAGEGPFLVAWQAEKTGLNAWDAAEPLLRRDPLLSAAAPFDHPAGKALDRPGCKLQAVGVLAGDGRAPNELLALVWDTEHREALARVLAELCERHGGSVQAWSLGEP